jgi:hypothetical protein
MVTWTYDDAERFLSENRLKYWKVIADGDKELGLALHHRNSLIAGIMYADLLLLEVSLRNSFDRELRNEFGSDWPSLPDFKADERMKSAKEWALKASGGTPIRHDKLMVNLQFAFWVGLLSTEKFGPIVSRAFKTGDVREFRRGLRDLVRLRNDIAHHEPVIDRDGTRRSQNLKRDVAMVNSILSSLDLGLGEWLRSNSSIQRLMKSGFVSCKKLKNHLVRIYVP